MRFLSGEYTAAWKDVKGVLAAVEPYVLKSDKDHIARILTKDCPTKLVWEETAENKEIFIKRGYI